MGHTRESTIKTGEEEGGGERREEEGTRGGEEITNNCESATFIIRRKTLLSVGAPVFPLFWKFLLLVPVWVEVQIARLYAERLQNRIWFGEVCEVPVIASCKWMHRYVVTFAVRQDFGREG